MKAYLSFIRLRLHVGLQYRFAAIAGIATQFFWGAMMIMMYEAYYRSGIDVPMAWGQLVSYIWLGQAFLMITYFNSVDSDIHESIVTGQVSYELIRPFSIYWHWYAKLFAGRLASGFMRCLPLIIVPVLLPNAYALQAPSSAMAFLLFLLTLFLGLLISLGISMIIYSLMFYTTSSRGLFSVYATIADFLSGGVIPIPFMPKILQMICYILPFRLGMDLPFRLYVGNISIQEGWISIGFQLLWLVAIVTLGNLLITKASKKLVIQGG